MDFLSGLNSMQQKAVLHTTGPLLILAGAGSGKTRVLTHRIANLITNENINPWEILAITFTNKAALEMRERIGKLIGEDTLKDMWISTFHSMCVRILRRDGNKIGYNRYFTIYDTSDQKSLIKDILKLNNIPEKDFPIGTVLSSISSKKNHFILPKQAKQDGKNDYRENILAQLYDVYQDKLFENNAMDFDDLLINVCILFQSNTEVLDFYQRKFKYILVDEYQDTNTVQYELIRLLSNASKNLCVVGDDDQSIYGWRGADIRNILGFEQDFPNTMIIKLEQNYRSTKNILDAANKVVSTNKGRKDKTLFTQNDTGEKISVVCVANEYREADFVANTIVTEIESGNREYKNFAILYRTNAQSRVLEEKMIYNDIPYRMLGGVKFYERKEIKDIIAYLRVITNNQDDVATKRIINVPKRGIGATSIQKIDNFAINNNIKFYDCAKNCSQLGVLANASAVKVMSFVQVIEELRDNKDDIVNLIKRVLEKTDYINYIKQTESEDSQDRIQNIQEFVSKATAYMKNAESATLEGFLEEVALVADIDNYDSDSNAVILMTLHSAKGLEFPIVFMPGLEEGLFPSYMSDSDDAKLEEERRLCYVGITRACEKLHILYTNERTVYGQTRANTPSRFIGELPEDVIETIGAMKRPKSNYETYRTSYTSPQKKTFNSQGTYKPPLQKEIPKLYAGDIIKHKKFGRGTIVKMAKMPDNEIIATIEFESGEKKNLNVKYANLQKG
ncbi:MAG: ATP-dependent DNA helicase PcrA [Epulopiscium sp. Nuni2H_MBin003]|nr:MAG: ATP-dependent DNA helicase PcrA [Epulopiscium sp. Nuni2H_MBin003]